MADAVKEFVYMNFYHSHLVFCYYYYLIINAAHVYRNHNSYLVVGGFSVLLNSHFHA